MNKSFHVVPGHKNYLEEALPAIESITEENNLHVRDIEGDYFVDPYEGEQFDYVIKLDEPVSAKKVVEMSMTLAERLNYSLPINVTIRFDSRD